MSEKRFELDVRLDMPKLLIDNATNKRYHLLLVNDIEEIVDLLNELSEENKQLQKTINEVIGLLLEEVGLFSDKATEHDIIAYKEMNEFDNKDAYSMCISTKKAIKMLQRCL